MIEEIAKFIDTIPQEYHTEGLKPSIGLHVVIDLNEDGELKKEGYRSFLVDKNNNGIIYNFDFSHREQCSKLIDMQKSIDTKKKIHSSVPYVISFKNLSTDDKSAMKKKDWDSLDSIKRREEIIKPYLLNTVKKRIGPFYDFFISQQGISEDEKGLLETIKAFSSSQLFDLLIADENVQRMEYNTYFKIYFNVAVDLVKRWFCNYVRDKVFNKNDYNTVDNEYGLSNFLNGANAKKVFMMHNTTAYEVNNRIHYKQGIKLVQFEDLLKNKKLPNIIPIFIDKEELNSEFIKIFKKESEKDIKNIPSFRSIIRQLFEQHKDDISNYYLMNWTNRNGILINDIDYVPKFRYRLDGFIINNVTQLPNIQSRDGINNIFDFEISVVQKIFSNALVVKTKNNTVLFKYFDDIDPKYTTQINYQNILKYRKSFYDFIYKSKDNAITGKMFYDLLLSNILDDIKHDEYRDNWHTKDFSIKEKLNILFSLNKNFDKQNKNFGGEDMASKIPEYQENMRKLLNDNDYHIQTDQEFAFTAGQLIYYILTKSQTSNKTHALLEPFISKNEPELFKQTITRAIGQYKHAFEFGGKRFEKLTGDVLGYDCTKKIKEILPIILAGYFSQSID